MSSNQDSSTPASAIASTSSTVTELSTQNTESNEKKETETVRLLISGEEIVCSRELLLNNSDYFKVMMKGDFMEKDKETFTLKEANANGMRNLLNILRNRAYFLECEDIYAVLGQCRMFLFEDLQKWIILQLDRTITFQSCLRMWLELEALEIYPLCWKAKNMSLLEFNEIATYETILELSLLEICHYLGHINLQSSKELSVFQTAMLWYNNHPTEDNSEKLYILQKLMGCISFKYATLTEIRDMRHHHIIEKFPKLLTVLDYILSLKLTEGLSGIEPTDKCYRIAQTLVQSQCRQFPKAPFLLMKSEDNQNSIYEMIYYDPNDRSFKVFSDLPIETCANWTGFGMQDYKMNIFLFGGEFSMGKGSWNQEMWSYNSVERTVKKTKSMPSPRRHFESCVCGDYLYIVGGTGSYRVIQANMYCYSFNEGKWGKEIVLPCSGKQIKCCNFNNQLFIFSLSERSGYFFSQDESKWIKVSIDIRDVIPKVFSPFSIFSYRDKIYLRGEQLLEFQIQRDRLRIVKIHEIPAPYKDDLVETVINHNYAYTLFKHKREQGNKMSLELLNLNDKSVEFLCELQDELTFGCSVGRNRPLAAVKLFMFTHYSLVCHNMLVNPLDIFEDSSSD